MAIPTPLESTDIQYLQDIIDKADADELGNFPMPTKYDFALIGALVVIFSYIDFNLLRIIEVMDEAGRIREKLKGKTAKLNITEVEEVVKTGDWSEPNKKALDQISILRPVRNLMGHFTVRRFPQHDAFFLLTKSARDFKQVFGQVPQSGHSMTAVLEVEQIRKAVKEAEKLVAWLSKAAAGYEAQWRKASGPMSE